MRRQELTGIRNRVKPPARGLLPPPREAVPRLRRLFDPVAGWYRRLERSVNHFLGRKIFPRLPFMASIYEAILRRNLTVAEAEVSLPGLSPSLSGVSILILADIHLGPFLRIDGFRRAMERLTAMKPDLVLLAGDIVNSKLDELEEAGEVLAGIEAGLGVHAVMGNHEHYTEDIEAVKRALGNYGITVLHNRSVVIEREGGRLALAGIDDLIMGSPDLQAALAGIPSGIPVILASHNPDILFEAAERGVDLVLAGHTHGGQVRIPGLPVLVRMSRYRLDEGRYLSGRTEIVVGRGLGVVGLPLRIWCPPEAVLVRLSAASEPTSPVSARSEPIRP